MTRLCPTLCVATAIALVAACMPHANAEEFEAVTGSVSPDYIRKKQADGKFVPESYAFGKGGYYSGPLNDRTIDKIGFLQVAHVMSDALKTQNYFPGFDPKTTRLLIMVYWGTSYAPEHASASAEYSIASDEIGRILAPNPAQHMAPPRGDKMEPVAAGGGGGMSLEQSNDVLDALSPVQAENRMRDKADALNAALLGYNSWWNQFGETDLAGTALEDERQDMLTELEDDRYFVVLMAYDFQLMRTKRLHKLLWDTRFSIREHKNAFDEKLPAMALQASRYFGQDSGGLTHSSLPDGHVEIGELKNLGPLPEK